MELKGFFRAEQRDYEAYSWTHLTLEGGGRSAPADLVHALADRIVQDRCPPHHYSAWVAHRDAGTPLPTSVADAFPHFIKGALGAKDAKPPKDHLEGYIAEALWYFLSSEYQHRNALLHIEWGWEPTDAGPDGFIVHGVGDGQVFRLWEVKKSVGRSGVSPVIARASSQLSERAASYLARLSKVGSASRPEELRLLFEYLVEWWLAADNRAAAGIALASPTQSVPADCFHQLPEALPQFHKPSRLRGLWVTLPDFEQFCQDVREAVWNGL